MRLMLSGELTPKERAVARALIWLETRVLRPTARAHEARTAHGMRAMLVKDGATWLLVEADPVDPEHAAVLSRLSDLRLQVHRRARDIQSQVMSLEAEINEFRELSKLEAELNKKATRRVRVDYVQRKGPIEGPARDTRYEIPFDDVGAQLIEHLDGLATLVTFGLTFLRSCLDPRDPKIHYEVGLLDLLEPVTLDEWRASRQFIESEFAAAGFDTGEVAQVLPDGEGRDGRRRAAMRRKRGGQRQRAAIDFTNSLPAMFGVGGGDPA